MKMKHWFWALVIFGILSCEVIIDPPLISGDPVRVVEADLIKGSNGRLDIKLYWSVLYNETLPGDPIDANISLRLNNNASQQLTPSAPGIYVLEGIDMPKGGLYRLSIEGENLGIIARDRLLSVPDIDSLTALPVRRQNRDTAGYSIEVFFTDPPDEKQYYMWTLSGLDSYTLIDGELINGQAIRIVPNRVYQKGETVEFCLQSLSQHAFEYYTVIKQITETNSSSITIPNNPVTNLQGTPALGYFTVSSKTCSQIIID